MTIQSFTSAVGLARRRPAVNTVVAASCGCGALVAVAPGLPTWVSTPLLAAFILVGPGVAVLQGFPAVPRSAVLALVPLIGPAMVILLASLTAGVGFWHPTGVLVILITGTILTAVVSHRRGIRT